MNRRQEPCRNFLRGSCKYGGQCKFLHVSQQQTKPKQFGFGTQSTHQYSQPSQQQKPNPFGFGVQNTSQFRNSGATHEIPAKPFENKWSRSSSLALSKQSETQTQATTIHECTDPELCKCQILEDFKNESPLWKLTCYSHCKSGPCDIGGDTSFEELRAVAYEEAKQGHSLQSIVERERNLLNSKLTEFESLLHNTNLLQNRSLPLTKQFLGSNNAMSSGGSQSPAPLMFSSFSQLGAAANVGSGFQYSAPALPSSTLFGQLGPSAKTNQTPGGFDMKIGASGTFGSLKANQPFGSSQSPISIGSSQGPTTFGSSRGYSISNFSHSAKPTGNDQIFPLVSSQFGRMNKQSFSFLSGPAASSTTTDQTSAEEKQGESQDASIWLKEQWLVGEIPEEEPPQRYC